MSNKLEFEIEFENRYFAIKDNNSTFLTVDLINNTPHCTLHGAMNKVSKHEDGGGYWRCLIGNCRSGVNQVIIKKTKKL